MHKVLILASFLFSPFVVVAEPVRLTAFGDSLVHGYGLPQGDGFVPQLERWLQEQGQDVEVANAGVSGDTSAGGLARIDWTLSDQPDGLIVLLGGNDILRGLQPEQLLANLRGILQAAEKSDVEVLLIGMTAPQNYGSDYKLAFDAVYPTLAQEFDAILHPDAFTGMRVETGNDLARAGALLQDDGIHPNAKGVALNIEALGPKVLALIDRIPR